MHKKPVNEAVDIDIFLIIIEVDNGFVGGVYMIDDVFNLLESKNKDVRNMNFYIIKTYEKIN